MTSSVSRCDSTADSHGFVVYAYADGDVNL